MNFVSGPVEFRIAQVSREIVAAGIVITSLTQAEDGFALWLGERVSVRILDGDGRLPYVEISGCDLPYLGRRSSESLLRDIREALRPAS